MNEAGSIAAGSMVLSVQFSPDGSKIVSGLSNGTIKVWDAGYQKRQLNPRSPARL